MTLAAAVSFQPVARKDYLDRLAAFSPRPALTPEFWSEVHDEVQGQLGPLETDVRQRVPEVRVATGRTKGDNFYLFSYRTFSVPDSALDPVVAGMNFTPAHRGVTVEADVSGEQSGDWISSVPSKTVTASRKVLLTEAHELARELCQSAEAIATALKDPSRRVE